MYVNIVSNSDFTVGTRHVCVINITDIFRINDLMSDISFYLSPSLFSF